MTPFLSLRSATVAAAGMALVAIGLAHRTAFFTWEGVALVTTGFVLVAASTRLRSGATRAFPVLFAVLAVIAALAPFDPAGINPVEAGLTIGSAVAFYAIDALPGNRALRLAVPAALLLAAHAHFLARFPHPLHEDVWAFLNGGVDLLAKGQNPYLGVHFIESGVAKVVPYTYPPGALILLAPFRLLAGDVRWAYVAAEAGVVCALGFAHKRSGGRARWQDALLLVPLALPRTAQAFYIFSNHEWVLLALEAGAVALAWQRQAVAAGVLLGLAVASKQYVLMYPVFFLTGVLPRRTLLVGAAVAAAVSLPFLVWSPADFLRDVFGNLAQGVQPDRLTVWAALAHLGLSTPRAVPAVAAAIVLAGSAYVGYRVRTDIGLALVTCGLSLAAIAFVSTFAAYNYYAYALVFVTWGLMLRRPAGSPPPV